MKALKINTAFLFLAFLTTSLTGQNQPVSSTDPGNTNQSILNRADQCQALFTTTPDSLTSTPFFYHFKDNSTGNINSWLWDFGDGSFSTEQNPSHQYQNAGEFNVCLIISNINQPANCSDQFCQNLATLDYFSLGGLVYAGEYPLNNPINAGDTGIVSLYRMVNNQITFVEDQYFHDYGYYWFGYLIPGEYIVKVALTPGSTNYHQYFTTYYGDEISWTKAETLDISTTDQFAAEIHLKPVQAPGSGTGIIKGYVNFEQDQVFSVPPMSQTTVILSDKYHNPLIFTHPNAAGYFEFTGIPFNAYYLSADATGKPASAISVNLTENTPMIEGINLTIFGSNVNFIPENINDGICLTRIYPNPAKDYMHISLYSAISANIGIRITDITGKVMISRTGKFETGFNDILIPVQELSTGIYFLVLQAEGNYLPVTAKFVK